MRVTLKFDDTSSIDKNLDDARPYNDSSTWEEYLLSIPYVIDAEWYFIPLNSDKPGHSYTIVTFASEAHKTWFLVRWS